MKFMSANKIAPAASHLGLLCLPTSNKKDARLYRLISHMYSIGLAPDANVHSKS